MTLQCNQSVECCHGNDCLLHRCAQVHPFNITEILSTRLLHGKWHIWYNKLATYHFWNMLDLEHFFLVSGKYEENRFWKIGTGFTLKIGPYLLLYSSNVRWGCVRLIWKTFPTIGQGVGPGNWIKLESNQSLLCKSVQIFSWYQPCVDFAFARILR